MNIQESDEYKIFLELKEFGIIFENRVCTNSNCKKKGSNMTLQLRKRSKQSEIKLLTWRCNSCTTYKSIFEGSFFSMFRKPVKVIMALIKCWSASITISKTCDLIQLNFQEN